MAEGVRGRRVYLTGASGFLGRSLKRRLEARGDTVIAPMRADGFDLLTSKIDLQGAVHVYHLAALTGVPDAWQRPEAFYNVNANGTVRVLEACRLAGVGLTYVSGYVYGAPTRLPIREDDPVRPNNPYAFSKFAGEEACRFYAATLGVRTAILRPFNIYGPEQDERFVLPAIIHQVVDPAKPEIVVRDLPPKRDYIHIDDVLSAILALDDAEPGAVFNAGSGHSVSVAEVIALAQKLAGVAKPVRSLSETRPNEIMDVVADVSRLAAKGWRAGVDLDKGLAELIFAARKRLSDGVRKD